MDNPRQIMQDLTNRHGTPKPGEKEEVGKKWRASYNLKEPIKTIFKNLEELWIQAFILGSAYTENQLIDQILNNIKQPSLYMASVIE